MKSVFVLDDDPDQVDVLVQALAGKHMQVRGFSNPLRALAALVNEPADLFIADLSLAWIDGDDVIHYALRRCPELRVILVSGHVRGAEVAQAAGVRFFLKPLDLRMLKNAVEQALVGDS